MDMRADDGADAEPGSRWLTHRQLAEIRGISTASAIKLALRHGWRKQKDNRGTVRCLVPPEWTNPKDTAAIASVDERADVGADKSFEISSLQSAYEAALRAKQAQIDALEGQIEALKGEIVSKTTLIHSFEAERDGLLAVQARADRAEASIVGERNRADALRERLEATQDELRQAREAADQAHQHARKTEDAIKALRQTDDERKARGRWARLRAAWTGQ
jgi:hypothetical protein